MDSVVNRLANGLLELGVGQGEKICIWLPNMPEFLFIWFAISRAGAVSVPMNIGDRGDRLRHVLTNSRARALITVPELLPYLESIVSDLENMKDIIVVGDRPASHLGNAQCLPFQQLLAGVASHPSIPPQL